ncbi:MAG TPA: dephospho-CoA kinase [Longimicrobiales bacterium]|nr:dephospho-CoA kinase [Longimicrobiales bacterium]
MKPLTRKLVVASAILVVVVAVGTLLSRRVPEEVSAPLFVLVVIIEVVIAPIPGGAIGYLGAARYGFWQAWPLLYIGNVIGTTLVFWLARRFGAPVFEESVAVRTRMRYDAILEQHPLLLWAVYSIPLVPVDVLSILAGLSRLSARRFLFIACTGYIIYTGIVAFVGSFLADFIGVTEALSVLGALFLAGLVWWLWRQQKRPAGLFRIALTGNIASGKSEVAAVWQQAGATVIDADELARRAVEPGSDALERLVAAFGPGIMASDGTLDRAAMRRIAFEDDTARHMLEAIVHPEVERLRLETEQQARQRGVRTIVHAIPLLFETGMDDEFDVIVLVDAPEHSRRERLARSRGLTDAEAAAMIGAQLPAAEKRARAHHVIDNDGTLAQLRTRALQVWSRSNRRRP